MMQLFIVRHGHSPFSSDTDHQRPLSSIGMQQAQQAAQFINAHKKTSATQIICSDALRTLTTAQIIQQSITPSQLIKDQGFYSARVGNWCDAIMHHRTFENLILVGHNPTMSNLSHHLTTTHSFQFSPACVAHFSLEIAADGLKLPAQYNDFFRPDAK